MPATAPIARRRLKEIARLSRRRHREATGEFVVEGIRSIESAVSAGARLVEILVTPQAMEGERVSEVLSRSSAPILVAEEDEIAKIADTQTSQGVLAVAALRRVEPRSIEGAVVVLDGIQDPGNVGTLLRTAAWFGIAGIVAGPGTADPFGPKAVRSAMGALWDLDIAAEEDLRALLSNWRGQGRPIYGADLQGIDATRWRPDLRGVLVVGSEAHGLSSPSLAALDQRVTICGSPTRSGVESLNVAIATGILLHRWMGGGQG